MFIRDKYDILQDDKGKRKRFHYSMAKKKKIKEPEAPLRSEKEEKLFQNILRTTQQFLQGKNFTSMTEAELFERLKFAPQHLDLFRAVLTHLLKEKVVEVHKNRFTCPESRKDIITGILRVHPRGFGFLQPDNPVLYPQDIFIPKHLTQNAVDGDNVEVQINTSVVSEKGPEGKVVAILSRGRTHLAGIIREVSRNGDILAHVPLLGTSQKVIVKPSKEFDLKVGDRVVMEVIEWGDKDSETISKVSHYIGHISDPSCDIKAAVEEFEIRSDFPHKVIDEAKSFGTKVAQKDIKDREDLRAMECFTIDPDTAKDYDDAVSLTKDSEGNYFLGVHIADVSHYVRPGTALDDEAMARCNSTYFPGSAIPMLPGELSSNLCSLKANVNRLTVSVLVHLDQEGTVKDYRITRSVIKSLKRFTYKEAKQVLDGTTPSKHLHTMKLMVELCGKLKKKRYERGSIEFSIPDLVVIVDENGVPVKTDYVEYDITHQLIEEFMLKANELVALHVSNLGKDLTYRVHDVPAEENMKDFSILAGSFGFKLSSAPTQAELQALFDEALQTPYGQYLATSYIRRMRLAIYSADNIGHYGLGLSHYCHFTSPIRRYVDLVAHRILFNEPAERKELEDISLRCSEQERISAKAEGNVVLLKKLRFLDMMLKKEPRKQYQAVVTKVRNFGIFFEIIDLMLEGFLHVSELENDYYVYEEAYGRLKGVYQGGAFTSGEKITVMVRDIDFILLETSWSYVPSRSPRPVGPQGKKASFKRKEGKPERREARPARREDKKAGKPKASKAQSAKGKKPKPKTKDSKRKSKKPKRRK